MGMKASNAIATFFKYFVLILVGLIMIYPAAVDDQRHL